MFPVKHPAVHEVQESISSPGFTTKLARISARSLALETPGEVKSMRSMPRHDTRSVSVQAVPNKGGVPSTNTGGPHFCFTSYRQDEDKFSFSGPAVLVGCGKSLDPWTLESFHTEAMSQGVVDHCWPMRHGRSDAGKSFAREFSSQSRWLQLFFEDFVIGWYLFSVHKGDQFSSSARPSDE